MLTGPPPKFHGTWDILGGGGNAGIGPKAVGMPGTGGTGGLLGLPGNNGLK